jgi:phage terminase small subunit
MDPQAEKKPEYLTDKEYLFANYYLGEARFNATVAAKLAGYSRHTARQQGYENLTKPYIKKFIQTKSSRLFDEMGITQERV